MVFTMAIFSISALAAHSSLLIDDRTSGDLGSSLGTGWRLVTDQVMGGVSNGTLTSDSEEGRSCLRLSGDVSTENAGGFLKASLVLEGETALDASGFRGIALQVSGNGESYNVHLKTDDVWLPWQSYRASFAAPPGWREVRLDFDGFQPYRINAPLDAHRLTRLGVVAIGRNFHADLCIGQVGLYR
jgi:hypothetical protein